LVGNDKPPVAADNPPVTEDRPFPTRHSLPTALLRLIPRIQHQAARAVLTVWADFLVLLHAESFAGEILTENFLRIDDLAQFIAV
jgi:hypothetical protein